MEAIEVIKLIGMNEEMKVRLKMTFFLKKKN